MDTYDTLRRRSRIRGVTNWSANIMRTFDPLATGASVRLRALKTEAARVSALPHRKNSQALTWRDVRYSTLSDASECGGGCNTRRGRRVPVLSAFSARALPVRHVEKLNKGWYADDHGVESVWPIVASLPHGSYLAGYVLKDAGEHVLLLESLHDCREDAVKDAKAEAEYVAEIMREDSERFERMNDAENKCQELCKELQGMIAGRNASKYIRIRVRHLIDNLRSARKELLEATQAYERG